MPKPWEDEAVVFATFFDAGLRLPCMALLEWVLRLYRVELAQLTPNSLVKLAVFEWILCSTGTSGERRLFTYRHDGHCQPMKKKNTGETLDFGSVNFQSKPHCQMYVPALAARNQWDSDWTRKWFYHKSPRYGSLQSSGGLIHLTTAPEIELASQEQALL